MELKKKQNPILRNLNSPEERARILAKYAGIFPNNISEFGKTVSTRFRNVKNFSK